MFHITLLCSSVRTADMNRDFLLDQGLIGRADENCEIPCANSFLAMETAHATPVQSEKLDAKEQHET